MLLALFREELSVLFSPLTLRCCFERACFALGGGFSWKVAAGQF